MESYIIFKGIIKESQKDEQGLYIIKVDGEVYERDSNILEWGTKRLEDLNESVARGFKVMDVNQFEKITIEL